MKKMHKQKMQCKYCEKNIDFNMKNDELITVDKINNNLSHY